MVESAVLYKGTFFFTGTAVPVQKLEYDPNFALGKQSSHRAIHVCCTFKLQISAEDVCCFLTLTDKAAVAEKKKNFFIFLYT